MGTFAMSSNLSMTRPTTGITPNVGYGGGKKTETELQVQAAGKQEDILVLDVTQEMRDEIRAKVAELDVPNLLEIPTGPPIESKPISRALERFVGYDGSTFLAGFKYNFETHEMYNSNYLDILIGKASGNEHPNFFEYFQNMAMEIVSNFSTASTYTSDLAHVRNGINAVIEEIRQNIAEGKENPTENLQTKFTVGGVDWEFTDLLKTSMLIRRSFDGIDRVITMDYIQYAQMGLSIGNVKKFAEENLNEEQNALVDMLLQAKADYYDRRMEESMENDKDNWMNTYTTPQRQEYYKYGNWVSASNVEAREAFKELFSAVGRTTSMSSAMAKYNQMIVPINIAASGSSSKMDKMLENDAKRLNAYYSSLQNALSDF